MPSVSYNEKLTKLRELHLKLQALQALQDTQKIVTFRPIGGQAKFFSDQSAQIRLVLGDNRSGKSVVGACEAISHSLGYRPWLAPDHPDHIVRLANGRPIPVPNKGRVLAQNFQQAIKQTIWPKLQEWAPKGWYKIRKDNRGIPIEVQWKNGSEWHFMSDKQDDMDFEGTNGHWFWVDEPCGYKKFVALQRGLVDFSGHCWLTLTPLSQFWIQDIIEDRANDPDGKVKKYEFRIEDNELSRGGYLSREAIDDFAASLRPEERAARMHRQWMNMTGRVYKEWKAEPPYWVEPFDIPKHWPRVSVIDPHPKKPVAVLWAAISPDEQIFVYRELFDQDLHTIADVAHRMAELEGSVWNPTTKKWDHSAREHISMRLIDPASREQERTSGYTVQQKFAQCGIVCQPAPKRNAQVGYDGIHERLKITYEWEEPGLVIFNVCPTTKRNFQRFVWKEWESSRDRDLKGERQEVLKHEDDMIDNIRYIIQAGLDYRLLRAQNRAHTDHLNDWLDDNGEHAGMYSVVSGEVIRPEDDPWQTY